MKSLQQIKDIFSANFDFEKVANYISENKLKWYNVHTISKIREGRPLISVCIDDIEDIRNVVLDWVTDVYNNPILHTVRFGNVFIIHLSADYDMTLMFLVYDNEFKVLAECNTQNY